MKKFIMMFACLIAMSACFTSCSEDEDITRITTYSKLIGMWETTYAQGYYSLKPSNPPTYFVADLSESNHIDGLSIRLYFKPNGTGTMYSYNEYFNKWKSDDYGDFKYIFDKPFLTMFNDEYKNKYEIVRLSEDELVLRLDGENSERAVKFGLESQYIVFCLKKVEI